jgi:hypothetical protein
VTKLDDPLRIAYLEHLATAEVPLMKIWSGSSAVSPRQIEAGRSFARGALTPFSRVSKWLAGNGARLRAEAVQLRLP